MPTLTTIWQDIIAHGYNERLRKAYSTGNHWDTVVKVPATRYRAASLSKGAQMPISLCQTLTS